MSAYELDVQDATASGVVVACLAGEIDLTNARELEEHLGAAAALAHALLVVDINRVVFIDSAALHVFFKLAKSRGEGRLALVMEPTAAVSRTLDIVGMADAVRVVASLEDLELTRIG